MRPLFTNDELVAGADVPGFVDRYTNAFETVPTATAADLRIAREPAAGRLWTLLDLVSQGFVCPDPKWCSETLLDVFTEDLPSSEMASSLSGLPVDRASPVFIATEWGDATVAADWGFYLDHIVTVPTASVVAPPDASWVLGNHYGEFIAAYRTTLAHVRGIALVACFPRHDGVPVPKPQYLVRFEDESHWLSGDLRHAPLRCAYDGLLRTLADIAGVPVEHVDVLPEELARPPRTKR